MFKLTDKGPDGNSNPKSTSFMTGDIIGIEEDCEGIKIAVSRKGTLIFLGANCEMFLRTSAR